MLHFKKNTLAAAIALFICFNTYSLNFRDPDFFYSTDTSLHIDNITDTKDTSMENSINKSVSFPILLEGIGTVQATISIVDDNPSFSGLQLSSNSNNISNQDNTLDKQDILDDLLKQSGIDTHKQESENNHLNCTNNETTSNNNNISNSQLSNIPSYDDKTIALSSPNMKAKLQQIKNVLIYEYNEKKISFTRKKTLSKMEAEIDFVNALISEKILQQLIQIKYANIEIAKTIFDELKKLWICDQKDTFIRPYETYSRREQKIIKALGVNIIRMAEEELITRPDYIAKYASPESLKTIQEYQKKCIPFQQKGDRHNIVNETNKVHNFAKNNGEKDDFAINVCFALALKAMADPITTILYTIKTTPSLKTALTKLQLLEIKILDEAKQNNIILNAEIKKWTIERYGFDILAAARECYTSRPDYNHEPIDQSLLFDPVPTILDTIERRPLLIAHAELVNLDHQVSKALEDLKITDRVAQKECILKSFGRSLLEDAHKKYVKKPEHQQLVKSFITVDVPNLSIAILHQHNDYASVANEFEKIAEQVLDNANLCQPDIVAEIEPHIIQSLRVIKAPRNNAEFVFNVTIVDHLLTDLQAKSDAILTGKPVNFSLERSSELLVRGIKKFLHGINPIAQTKNLIDTGYLVGDMLYYTGDALYNHPAATAQKALTITTKACDFLINSAKFTIDTTLGKYYLSKQELQYRIDAYSEYINTLPSDHLAQLTAENYVDFGAQLAADMVFFGGITKAYHYLKEIDALGKISKPIGAVARAFKKGIDAHLADNPILVTAEGVAVKMSNDLKNVGGAGIEILTNSRTLIESMTNGLLAKTNQAIITLKEKFKCIEKCLPSCAKRGFAEFKNGHIKIAYEHILGIELIWNDVKNTLSGISGFHHDFMGTVEKSGLFKFVRTAEKNGCYMADIIVGEQRIRDKTFFPQHWSREDVVSKIYEAYENSIKSGGIPLEKGGKYIINGTTKEGIQIRMFITKNGHMKTAYPILEKGI